MGGSFNAKNASGLLWLLSFSYFFSNACLYSSHNFRQYLLEEYMKIDASSYGLIEILSLLKFVGSIGSTHIAERYNLSVLIAVVSTFLFISSLKGISQDISMPLKYVLLVVNIVSEASILPVIDGETLKIMDFYGVEKKFNIVRMSSAAGHSLIYIFNYALKNFAGYSDRECIVTTTLGGGVMTILALGTVFMIVYRRNLCKRRLEKSGRESAQAAAAQPLGKEAYIFNFMRKEYILVILCVILSGLSRTVLQGYLTAYIKRICPDKEVFVLYFVRSISEMGMWYAASWLSDRMSVELLFPLSIFVGAVRSCSYAFIDEKSRYIHIYPYLIELLKSFYSAMFIFSSIRLANKYSNPKHEGLAQGVFTGFYSGLAPSVSGIISYFVLYDIKDDISRLKSLFFLVGSLGIISTGIAVVFYVKTAKRTT